MFQIFLGVVAKIQVAPYNNFECTKMFPIVPHFYPICFGQSWIFIYKYKLGMKFTLGECPLFQKNKI
jgi:hypothetical protein